MNILPASLETLRQAVRHLEKGGLVLTAVDRPVADARLHPRFFGYPAPLPTHHILLALKARVPIIMMAVIRQKDGKFKVLSSEPMEMLRNPNHEIEIQQNAERVLQQAENFIQMAPQQWNVPLPIWPDLLKSVPE